MKYIKAAIAVILLVALDQWTKSLAVAHLKFQEPVPIIKNIFELQYLENRGAAFGLMQGQKIVFIILTVVVLTAVIFIYTKIPPAKKYLPLRVVAVFVAAGALGNFIDRMVNGFVVDFFYFKLINFPIFNVADIYVTLSAAALFILIIFYYKDKDLEFLNFKPKKNADI